jgi:hypothetical protein
MLTNFGCGKLGGSATSTDGAIAIARKLDQFWCDLHSFSVGVPWNLSVEEIFGAMASAIEVTPIVSAHRSLSRRCNRDVDCIPIAKRRSSAQSWSTSRKRAFTAATAPA